MDEERSRMMVEDRRDQAAAEGAARDRRADHAPVELPLSGTGETLYDRAGRPGWPGWLELDVSERRAWAQCERFLAHKRRQATLPGALRFELPETAPEQYDRHVQAVEAQLARVLRSSLVGEIGAVASAEWLREQAEALLAAADVGI